MAQMGRVGKHKTRVYEGDDGYKSVTYRGCPVVQIYPQTGEIVLDTCGWESVTTKTRMNQAANQFGLPYRVYQKDYVWYVERPSGKTEVYGKRESERLGKKRGPSYIRDTRNIHVIKDLVL